MVEGGSQPEDWANFLRMEAEAARHQRRAENARLLGGASAAVAIPAAVLSAHALPAMIVALAAAILGSLFLLAKTRHDRAVDGLRQDMARMESRMRSRMSGWNG